MLVYRARECWGCAPHISYKESFYVLESSQIDRVIRVLHIHSQGCSLHYAILAKKSFGCIQRQEHGDLEDSELFVVIGSRRLARVAVYEDSARTSRPECGFTIGL